jgi:hypothetical protein
LLVRVLREPHRLESLAPHQLSRVLDAAEHARLLGWLLTHAGGKIPNIAAPVWLRDRFISALSLAAEYDRSVRWETERVNSAFAGSNIRWVLLKGAAYLAAGLPPGRGRRVADLDLLVAETQLSRAEELLRERGWEFPVLDPYDDRFYREWMHEVPPMVHRERQSIVDLHHAILPRTSRRHPSTNRLLERSIETEVGIRVLCPSHMVLHAAAHLFHDGEIAGAIRDLVDLDGLLRGFGQDQAFWSDFREEAKTLGLERPAYYALRYTQRLLNTPIPDEVTRDAASWGPPTAVRLLMDVLVERTVQGNQAVGSDASALALYIRSHWLRMPPLLLARHLWRKGLRSR